MQLHSSKRHRTRRSKRNRVCLTRRVARENRQIVQEVKERHIRIREICRFETVDGDGVLSSVDIK